MKSEKKGGKILCRKSGYQKRGATWRRSADLASRKEGRSRAAPRQSEGTVKFPYGRTAEAHCLIRRLNQ